MPSKTQLINGNFQDAEGNVLANGYLTFELSQDTNISGSLICAGFKVTIKLDSTGNVSTSPTQFIWGTDVMSPTNVFYKVTGFNAKGQPVWGPNNQQVTTGTTFDLDTWIPNQLFVWNPVLTLQLSPAPATSSSVGIAGEIAYDSGFLYVCVAASTWKRTAITTF